MLGRLSLAVEGLGGELGADPHTVERTGDPSGGARFAGGNAAANPEMIMANPVGDPACRRCVVQGSP
jgi:hypothetical protein